MPKSTTIPFYRFPLCERLYKEQLIRAECARQEQQIAALSSAANLLTIGALLVAVLAAAFELSPALDSYLRGVLATECLGE